MKLVIQFYLINYGDCYMANHLSLILYIAILPIYTYLSICIALHLLINIFYNITLLN